MWGFAALGGFESHFGPVVPLNITGCLLAAHFADRLCPCRPRCRSVKSALGTGLPVEQLHVCDAPCYRQWCGLFVHLTIRRRRGVKGAHGETTASLWSCKCLDFWTCWRNQLNHFRIFFQIFISPDCTFRFICFSLKWVKILSAPVQYLDCLVRISFFLLI